MAREVILNESCCLSILLAVENGPPARAEGLVKLSVGNILLDRKGRVKVADFGLARLMGLEAEVSASGSAQPISASATLTEAGKIMGTPRYMAPEQTEKPTEVDHRADIYSLGVVLYQMLTGELPGKRIEPPSKKVQLDVRLDEVVPRALEREPERRYQQASQVKTDVETIASGIPASDAQDSKARQEESPRPPGGWRMRAPFLSPEAKAEQIKLSPFGRGAVLIGIGVLSVVLLWIIILNFVKVRTPQQQPGNALGAGVQSRLSFGPVIERT